jgi:hypothetical protein
LRGEKGLQLFVVGRKKGVVDCGTGVGVGKISTKGAAIERMELTNVGLILN